MTESPPGTAGRSAEGGAESAPGATGGRGSVSVVGTAHVSEDSVEEVRDAITEQRPDVVAVELDEGRYRRLKGEDPEDLEASDLLHGNTVFQFLAYWMLSYVQTRLGERFDVTPGADMLAAVETAEGLGLDVALVDREIQTTVQRFWTRLTAREKATMVGGLLAELEDPRLTGATVGLGFGAVIGLAIEALAGPVLVPAGTGSAILGPVPGLGAFAVGVLDLVLVTLLVAAVVGVPTTALLTRLRGDGEVAEFDVEQLTDTDVVSAMMEEFRRFSPGGAEALVDERDAYIAHELVALRESGKRVVAVVGAGHREGIEAYLAAPETLPPKDTLTGTAAGRRFSLYKLVGYAVSLGFVAFFVLLALGGASQRWLLELFVAWFLVNAVFAGGLALLAGARLPSALVGGSVAWLTSVNPLLAPGWFAGYVELRYLDVSVADISTLNEILDDESATMGEILERMRAVPLFRLILVVGLTNVGSMVASLVVFPAVLPVLSAPIGGVDAMGGLLLEGARIGAGILLGAVT